MQKLRIENFYKLTKKKIKLQKISIIRRNRVKSKMVNAIATIKIHVTHIYTQTHKSTRLHNLCALPKF